jgi:glyoxylase-like metal-dependent hydrolase (beta-lactamase superfamily II)
VHSLAFDLIFSSFVTNFDIPKIGTAAVHVLHDGYVREEEDGQHVGSTVTLIVDGDVTVVVDPGMVASREALLLVLSNLKFSPESVSDVVFSHHHPDHTVNAALFPNSRIHDYWAIYDGDIWIEQEADGYLLSPNIRLIATPGHTNEDISTIASTPNGIFVCTHAWWAADGPADDPFSPDSSLLERSREQILAFASVIIPGHGPPFSPISGSPR